MKNDEAILNVIDEYFLENNILTKETYKKIINRIAIIKAPLKNQ